MATVAIAAYDASTDNGNIQLLSRGAPSADIIVGGAQLDDDDTVTIDVENNDDIIIALLDTGGGSTVSVAAGDYPISPHAGKGADSVTVPDGDLVLYVPEAGRHVKSTGLIHLTVATGGQVLVWVYRVHSGFKGYTPMNPSTIPAGEESPA